MKTKRELNVGDFLKVPTYKNPILVLNKHYTDDQFIQCLVFEKDTPKIKSFFIDFFKKSKLVVHYNNLFEGINEIFKGIDVKKTIEQDASGDVCLGLTLPKTKHLNYLFLYEEVSYKGENLSFFNYYTFLDEKRKEEDYTTIKEYPKDISVLEFFEKARNCFLSGNSVLDMI